MTSTQGNLRLKGITQGSANFIANVVDRVASRAAASTVRLAGNVGGALSDFSLKQLGGKKGPEIRARAGAAADEIVAASISRDRRTAPVSLRHKNVFVGGRPVPSKGPRMLENLTPKKESAPVPVVLQETDLPPFTAIAAPVVDRARARIRKARGCSCHLPTFLQTAACRRTC